MSSTMNETGFFGRMRSKLMRDEELTNDIEESVNEEVTGRPTGPMAASFTITVHRSITSQDDLYAAGFGLRRGEAQIINLTQVDPTSRKSIIDFMKGVNFTVEGFWEEIGENIYLVAPRHAFVEVSPVTQRMSSARNQN